MKRAIYHYGLAVKSDFESYLDQLSQMAARGLDDKYPYFRI